MAWIEAFAFALGVINVTLVVRRSVWNYPFALAMVSLYAAVCLSVPFLLWQIWAFVAPGLYPHERSYAFPFIVLSSLAFVAGAAAVLGFSPVDFFPATLAALVVLVHLWVRAPSPQAAFGLGYFFGLGLYGAGASWVYVSLNRFGGMPMPLATVATLA